MNYREKVLKVMDELILGSGDEELIYLWQMFGLPDGYGKDDLEYIAGDNETYETVIECGARALALIE